MPSVTSHKPAFGRWAPILTCILWCSVIAGWVCFLLLHHTSSATSPHTKSSFDSFFAMLLYTAVLFASGLIILVTAAISYGIRSRTYRLEQQAVAASHPIPPS